MMRSASDLPIRPSEAAALADVVFQTAQEHRVGSELRQQLSERIGSLGLGGLQAYASSLSADPVQASAYYIAADALPNGRAIPVLLHFALASAAGNGHFTDSALVGRLRPGGGREIAVTAIPFAPTDRANIAAFVEHVERAYLPRPQGTDPSISAHVRDAQAAVPIALAAFRTILGDTGWNAAAMHATDAVEDVYYTSVWAAIRAGWREGYSLEADRIALPADPATIPTLSGYTGFSVNATPLLDLRADHRSAGGWSEPDVMRLYEEGFAPELRAWAESEFAHKREIAGVEYVFARHEIRRLVAKFGRALLESEAAYDAIAKTRDAFDFEIAIDECETLTTGKELVFCLQWMKAHGRTVRSIAANIAFKADSRYPENMKELVDYTRPKLWIDLAPRVAIAFHANPIAELTARVCELSRVAAQFGAVLAVYGGRETQPAAVHALGQATEGALLYKAPAPIDGPERLVSIAHSLRS